MQSGTVVTSGQVLAVIEEGAGGARGEAGRRARGAKAAAATAPAPRRLPLAQRPPLVMATRRESGKLSPSVRRLVEENRLDPARDPGVGVGTVG